MDLIISSSNGVTTLGGSGLFGSVSFLGGLLDLERAVENLWPLCISLATFWAKTLVDCLCDGRIKICIAAPSPSLSNLDMAVIILPKGSASIF